MSIIEKNMTSLDEFWEYLSPIGPLQSEIRKPIFRGQACAGWHLTPSVFRNDIIEKYARVTNDYKRTEHVILLEFMFIHQFLWGCDDQGIQIPYDHSKFRENMNFSKFTERHSDYLQGWPSEEFHPILAMAQHHGIPTRLLDWSKNPIVGMYFAASQALSLKGSDGQLAVWVIDNDENELKKVGLETISVAGSVSCNLAAQKGLFLLYKESQHSGHRSPFSPNDELSRIDNLLLDNDKIRAYKVTLPKKYSGELLFRCHKFNTSATTLFPGSDGVAKGVLEFQLAKRHAGIL